VADGCRRQERIGNKCHGDQIPYLAILEPSKPHIGRGAKTALLVYINP
jgi:hypothetical protein